MGIGELLVVFVILMVLFGASKLPGLGKGLGAAVRNFKDAVSGPAAKADPPSGPPRLPPADPPSGGAGPAAS